MPKAVSFKKKNESKHFSITYHPMYVCMYVCMYTLAEFAHMAHKQVGRDDTTRQRRLDTTFALRLNEAFM
jgi:hypothetical protein